ncbi:competence protein CoiA [Metabacillus mangrovi]|nr:competence protein CoiA family protein [Metabacillus mangrovi]
MLTSITSKGPFSLLSKAYSLEELTVMREIEVFTCPGCRERLDLKLGAIKRYHFAHRRKSACDYSSEPESERHLLGKQQLYEQLQSAGTVLLEPYLKEIGQRPDLLIETPDKKYAVEYQCSSIPAEQVERRSSGYRKIGIEPIWILGANQLTRLSASEYRLNRFHWCFAKMIPYSSTPYLLFYSPDDQQLLQVSGLYPFSKQIFFAQVTLLAVHQVLFPPPSYRESFPLEWLRRKVYRYRQLPPPKQALPLQKHLYAKKGLPLSMIPSIVFTPTPIDYAIETEPYIWKTWLLLWAESRKVFTLEEAVDRLWQLSMEGRVAIRGIRGPAMEEVLSELGSLLLQAGFLQKGKNKQYKLIPIIWHSSAEQIHSCDDEFFRLISRVKHNL